MNERTGLAAALFAGLFWFCGAFADGVDDLVTAEMKRQHMPGLSIAIVKIRPDLRNGSGWESRMPRVRFHVSMSLDGYIAGPRGEFDWIVREPAIDFAALFAQFDSYLVGRRTFELMRKPGSPPLPPGSNVFVFSKTLPDSVPGASVVREISPTTIAAIKAQARKDVWLFGGAELFRGFLDASLVDTVEVAIIPVLLGGGLQLLPQPAKQARLQLTAHRVYPSGIVSLDYRVAPRAG